MASFTSIKYYSLTLFFFTIITLGQLNAQTRPDPICGYKMMMDQMESKFPGYKAAEQRSFEYAQSNPAFERNGEVYRIPVVFHVIYNNDKQNIPDEYILDQLDILNHAFRNKHNDVGQTRPIFQPLAGDAEIEFYLAPKDPEGNPTSGITRTKTDIEYFGDFSVILGGFDVESFERIKYTDKGGYDGWPSNRYLNIWIADEGFDFFGIYIPAVLGLATPPTFPQLPDNWPEGAVDGIKDGVFLQYQTIGANNPYKDDLMGLVSQGRTAVHEIGHYLGLRHIDGDEGCGTDGIDDTPVMDLSTQAADCPATDVNTCDLNEPNDMPDMWENYMDYSNDICQTLFTKGQVSHMRKVLSIQRDTLINGALSVNKEVRYKLSINPNPAMNEILINNIPEGGQLSIFDIFGNRVMNIEILRTNRLDISNLSQGIYNVRYVDGIKTWESKLIVVK